MEYGRNRARVQLLPLNQNRILTQLQLFVQFGQLLRCVLICFSGDHLDQRCISAFFQNMKFIFFDSFLCITLLL